MHFNNKISTNTKLSKVQISKIIPFVKFCGKTFGNMIGNSGKKALFDLAVPLAKDICLN